MKASLTAIAAALLISATPWAAAQNIAIVNGKPVPTSRLDALVAHFEKTRGPVDDNAREALKQEAILREVFMQEAERRGVAKTAEYAQQMELARQGIMIQAMFENYKKTNPVTDEEVKAEYDKFVEANAGKEYRARHILVPTEKEAKDLIAQIKKGAKFEALAKSKSKDPGSGANGGDLDWASASSYVTEFSEAMVKLDKGQMTEEPVKSQFGWHIIRVDDVREAQMPSFDEVKPTIAEQMGKQKLMAFQRELEEKAKVE
ncbi:peptidylprolyl isomerase [Hydrogenophaga sp. 5NK40-0174]|uniref:peptidylprolyl isomerase n=1 Tax=Hydrogenophaga sp. 5NK40-0174 TaxID=3127649 RepID=UPI0031073A4E